MSAAAPLRLAADYAAQLRQLMPQGAAWSFAPDGPMAGFLLALGEEFARIDARGLDLLEEADPRTALELLGDWERVAALPDACSGAPDSPAERQAALHQKLTRLGSQSRAAYIEMAARLGYVIQIDEHHPFRMGCRMGERVNGPDWAFAWTVRVRPFPRMSQQLFYAVFRMGDRMGTRLRGFGALDIECLIRRAAPAHTVVLFSYEFGDIDDFWFDFTA